MTIRTVSDDGGSPATVRPLRIGHLTTVDMSLLLLLGTELETVVEAGYEVFGISAPGPYVERLEALGVTHIPVNALTRSWEPRRTSRPSGSCSPRSGRSTSTSCTPTTPRPG